MSQPVRLIELGLEDLSNLMAPFKSKFKRILRFGTLVIWYLTLVGHTQSQVGHLRSVILKVPGRSYLKYMVCHIESVI